jgi:hypothetical protein
MQMTSRERVLGAMRLQPVDYVPCSPSFNALSDAQRRGKHWNFPWGPSQYEQIHYGVTELGTDPVVNVSAGGYEAAPEVSSRVWYDADAGLIHKRFDTPAGPLSSTVRYDKRWPHGLDIPFHTDFNPAHAVKFWLETAEDLEAFSYIFRPVSSEATLARTRFAFMEARQIADEFGLATRASVGLGLTGALQMFGPSELCIAMVETPELVDAYLELDHRLNMRSIEIALELGVDIIHRNGFYETADFYSPAMLRRFLLERLQAEFRAAGDGGVVTCYTINTGLMPMLEYLRELEVDCLFGVDIAHKDHDFARIVASQEGSKSFWVGPSSAYHLQEPDPEVTREAVRECFRVVGREGLIISPCPSLHSIMPWQNGMAMIEEWKRLR